MRQRKTLWGIALPLLLNMLISQVQLVIDRSFLGKLDVNYMSALGNVSAPFWTTMSVIWALTTGATVLMSQAIGAGKEDRVAGLGHSVLKFNTLVSLLVMVMWFFLADGIFKAMGVTGVVLDHALVYLRLLLPMVLLTGPLSGGVSILQAYGATRPVLISGIVRSGLNVVLDWVLIFGRFGAPAMGIRGAALATSIAEAVGTVVLFAVLLRPGTIPIRLSWREILESPLSLYGKVTKKGLPSAGEELLWNLGNLGIMRLLNSISMTAAGIFTMIFSIDILPALVFISMGQAVLTLTGHRTGEGDARGAVRVGLRGLRDSWIMATAMFLVFVLAPRFLLGIFTTDQAVIDRSVPYLIIAGIVFYPRSVNIILGHGIRGYGDTKWMMKTQIFGTVYIVACAAFLLFVMDLGILSVYIALLSDETIRAVINTVRFLKGPGDSAAAPAELDESPQEETLRTAEALASGGPVNADVQH